MSKTIIAYTLGEPGGIGPDIIIQLAQERVLDDVLCIGDRGLLLARAAALGMPLKLAEQLEDVTAKSCLAVKHVELANTSVCGEANTDNVAGVINMLDHAIAGCMFGNYAAMVTGPLHKGVINDAGVTFSGHTEYLAARTRADLPVMLLASHTMRVALVTTHLPLKDVSAAITEQAIDQTCRVIDRDLREKFGIDQPRILVCGLNPHAGEGGHLGTEEIDIIIPALEKLRAAGIDVIGPLPADTLFTEKYMAQADVALAMFHDQGLPVVKSQSFGAAANITLGLPIIRTSVDHGTAFDLAGSGRADIGSLQTAFYVAQEMVQARNV